MVLWSSVGNAQISVGVPNPNRNGGNNPMPTWFSGTNCEASGIAGMPNQTFYNFINHVQLLINGTVVWEKYYTYPQFTPIQPLVYFDSTHFNDASQVTVTINAWTSIGQTNTASNSATAYNKQYVIGNTLPANNGIGSLLRGHEAIGICAIPNHTRLDAGIELTRLRANLVTDLPPGTSYYIWSHGTPNSYGDAAAGAAGGGWVTNGDVATALAAPITGKSAMHYPPYNFVFLDTCECGSNDALAVAFGVAMHTGPSSPDRAFVGWPVNVPEFANNPMNDVDPLTWTTAFFQNLNSGKTVLAAINATNLNPGQIRDVTGVKTSVVKYGDGAAKVRGVYLGNLLDWYR